MRSAQTVVFAIRPLVSAHAAPISTHPTARGARARPSLTVATAGTPQLPLQPVQAKYRAAGMAFVRDRPHTVAPAHPVGLVGIVRSVHASSTLDSSTSQSPTGGRTNSRSALVSEFAIGRKANASALIFTRARPASS